MTVYLVGAGPGDVGMLTLRAHELLSSARVVAYDALVHWSVLNVAPPDAEMIAVGRRVGHGAAPRIHPAVVRWARRGDVVRLKGGDPFVFGRGGEEAQELARRGIPFEVVPGVTAGVAGPAMAGIPVTHRDYASSVRFHAGPGPETTVLYMASRRLHERLEEFDPLAPVAVIHAAGTERQEVRLGTVADPPDAEFDGPVLVIVGDVVTLRTQIAWAEARPLHGRTIVVGRTRPGQSVLARGLHELGAQVLEVRKTWPRFRPPRVDLHVFACSASVIAGAGPAVAIGPRTAAAAREAGYAPVHVSPGGFEGLLEEVRLCLSSMPAIR